jgi:hypothetical protein
MSSKALEEVLAGVFCDILKCAGISLSLTQLERIRMESGRLADHLEGITHNKTVEMSDKLQAAVVSGFENFEDEITRLDAKIDDLEEDLVEPPEDENEDEEDVFSEDGY